jgi:plasmid maintenance system killer protein
MWIEKIIERKDIISYLEKRNLLEKYKKAKTFILIGNLGLVNLKKRKPKKDEIWHFRVDKQFRALCYFDDTTLVVFDINNHQK